MAVTYIAVLTDRTYGTINLGSATESQVLQHPPRYLDSASRTSPAGLTFLSFGYQYTSSGTPPYTTPIYAIYITTAAGIGSTTIPSSWLQDGGPNGTNNEHVSSPSLYSVATNVWHHIESGNLTPMQSYQGGSTQELNVYVFDYDTEYIPVEDNKNVWQHTLVGTTHRYDIGVDQNSLWVGTTHSLAGGYRWSISISGKSETNFDGIVIFTSPHTSGEATRIDNMAQWSDCVVSGSGSNFSQTVTYDATSNTTLYIYFRTDSSTIVSDCGGTVNIPNTGTVLKSDPGFELTGQTTTSPTTAYIKGRAATTGTIKWGTSSSSMTNSVSVGSANTWVNVTSQTSVGSKTIYAYFVPSNTNSYNNSSTLSATAQMSAPANITVTINGNGGSGGTSSKSVAPGASSWSISSVPSRTGFQLLGFWDTSNYSGGTKYLNASGSSVRSAPTSSMTIYARWEPIVNYSTTSSSYTVYCTTSNHEASTTEGSQQITISSGGSTSSGLTITYSENNENWTVSSDGKKITIPNGLSAGTYDLEVSGTIDASNTTHNTSISSDNQITVTIVAVTKYPNNSNPTKYKNTSGTTGYNVTYGTPTASISSSLTAAGGTFYVTCSVTNSTDWYWKYTNGTYSSNQTSSETGTARWRITSNGNSRFSSPTSGGSSLTIGGTSYTTYPSGSSYKGSHSTMGTNATTDTVGITAYNIGDTSKNSGEKTASVTNSTSTSTSTTYGTPTVSIGSGIYASGGSATVNCTVTNTVTTTTTYTSGATSSSDSTVEGTARWKITTNGNNRFSHPSSGGVSLSGVGTVYNSGTKVYHDSMTNNATTDTVVVTAYNIGSTSKTATATDDTVNSLGWEKPVVTLNPTSVSMPAAGGTYNAATPATATQKQQYTSGYVVQTINVPSSAFQSTVYKSKTGYSLSSNVVTVTNNTSTSARNGFQIKVYAVYNNRQSESKVLTFNQPAGSQGNLTPVITGYSYSTAGATGVTNSAPTVTYQQEQNAWNGVAGTGTVVSTGGTLAYTTTGTLPSGFSTGTNFATTGNITWANNTSASTKDAKSNLKVTVILGGLTSSAYTCTACSQSAGSMVYANPSITGFSYSNFAASGATKTPSTITYSQSYTWNGVSGSGGSVTTGGTLAYATTGTLPSGFSTATNFATTGNVTWAGRGTTIGNSRDAKSNLTVTVTMNGKTSSAYTCTSCIQVGNYVTAIAPKDSSGGTGSHFSYANIGPGATSASPSLTGGATYTFTSGSTAFDTYGSPTFGGTATYSRTYSLGTVQNGFSAVNSSTGVLTATSMGTTVMNARTSGTVTSVLTVTYTHASSYSAGGTVTSSTKSSTATCTQNANAITALSLTVGTATISYGGTTSATMTATFTSGATLNVSNDSGTTYSTNPTGIVTVTKS